MAAPVVGLVAVVAPPWAGVLAVMVLGGVLVTLARQRVRGELRGIPKAAGGVVWSWRDKAGQAWRPVSLRLWLWPDSSDAESLRRLRRELLPLP